MLSNQNSWDDDIFLKWLKKRQSRHAKRRDTLSTSNANKKKFGTNHCPRRRKAVTDRQFLWKSLQSQELCNFIHHEPTFHLRVKNQRLISFFPSILHISTKILSNFFFVSTIPAFQYFSLLRQTVFESKRELTLHERKKKFHFCEGKIEIFL